MSIFRSAGCVLLHVVLSTGVVAVVLRIQTHTQCTTLHTRYKLTHSAQHYTPDTNSHTVYNTTHQLLMTTATTTSAEHHMQYIQSVLLKMDI